MLSLSLFRARRSDSSAGTGFTNEQTGRSNTHAESSMGSTSFGPTWSAHGSMLPNIAASQMPEVKRLVMLQATKKLFTNQHFSISTLREIAEIINVPTKGPAWNLLQPLHCVNYDDMPDQLRESIPHLVNECLKKADQIQTDTLIALNGVEI